MMNLRSRLTGIATGDQAIFVTRAAFEQVGGFPDIPLMEDIVLSRRLSSIARPACLRQRVVTSGRRWEKHGLVSTIFAMWWLRLRFFLGADPQALAREYGYSPREAAIAIAILAKAPLAGLAKTRLIPRLGADGAAALQAALLRRAVTTAQAADLGPVTLWCAPDCSHPAFVALAEAVKLPLAAQPAGDLGKRMHAAVCGSPAHVAGTLVIGTDCPALTPELLRRAAAALHENDATLIPAEDGGYVLIGLRTAEPHAFADIVWSTPSVAAQTRQRFAELGWRWHELAPLWDVDDAADFERLQRHDPSLAAATLSIHGPRAA
jgi:rSAM/selenodomain-associated transferase 1